MSTSSKDNVFLQEQAPLPYRHALATVEQIVSGGVIISTDDGTVHPKPCRLLASYSPAVGDRVYIVPFGDVSTSYLIIGKVV